MIPVLSNWNSSLQSTVRYSVRAQRTFLPPDLEHQEIFLRPTDVRIQAIPRQYQQCGRVESYSSGSKATGLHCTVFTNCVRWTVLHNKSSKAHEIDLDRFLIINLFCNVPVCYPHVIRVAMFYRSKIPPCTIFFRRLVYLRTAVKRLAIISLALIVK